MYHQKYLHLLGLTSLDSIDPGPPSEIRNLPKPSRLNHGTSTTSLASNASSKPSGYGEGYRYQTFQRKKSRRQNPVTGTRTDHAGLFRGARVPSRDMFVYRVDSIKDYIVNNDVEVISINGVSNENATLSRFKVEIRVSDMPQVLHPEFWPSDVHVRRFMLLGRVVAILIKIHNGLLQAGIYNMSILSFIH
jgi:hypothetical protein